MSNNLVKVLLGQSFFSVSPIREPRFTQIFILFRRFRKKIGDSLIFLVHAET